MASATLLLCACQPQGFSDRAGIESTFSPTGDLTGAQLRFVGWAADPQDGHAAVTIEIWWGFDLVFTSVTGVPRPDVSLVHPGVGPNSGYDIALPFREGVFRVVARSELSGDATVLTCEVIVLGPGAFALRNAYAACDPPGTRTPIGYVVPAYPKGVPF